MNTELVKKNVYERFLPFSQNSSIKEITIGGITHFLEDSGDSFRISLILSEYAEAEDYLWSSVHIKKNSVSLRRSETDFSETILKGLDLTHDSFVRPVDSVQPLIELEEFLNRPLPSRVFNLIFRNIVDFQVSPARTWGDSKFSKDKKLFEISISGKKPFLSISKEETDKQILGRILCGKLLYDSAITPCQRDSLERS